MTVVPRQVREARDSDTPKGEPELRSIREYRDIPAWVLLGEPGSGKTTLFKEEANTVGGQYLTLANFLNLDLDPDWQGKVLFLDGLDEIRAGSGSDSVLVQIRSRLRRLESPAFRIACRAADWFGSTDRAEISNASADGRLMVLELGPLSGDDIVTILLDNLSIADPTDFVQNAERRGIGGLLGNPKTLELLAKAVQNDQWPDSRSETYELACAQLAAEPNKEHRNRGRRQPIAPAEILDAAGQLCAVLLLADKDGVALDIERAADRYPELDACLLHAPNAAASAAVRRMLFRPEGEERVVPSHRTIAEYLAARWLGSQIDAHGLSLRRVLNLLLGLDGRTVSGLRGLYAWLAFHCASARSRLIDADPLTVIGYGDVRLMAIADKKRLLSMLRQEAEQHAAFRWGMPTSSALGMLADEELTDMFREALEKPGRDETTQVFVECVVEILAEGDSLPNLAPLVKRVIVDDSRWTTVRKTALKAWLHMAPDIDEVTALLNDIADNRIADSDDELAGLLLKFLYPAHLAPDALLRHLHVPKNERLIGNYAYFWDTILVREAPASHLAIILDQLAARNDLLSSGQYDFHINKMMEELLVRGLKELGDSVDDEELLAWLGIGTDKFGHSRRDQPSLGAIATWLEVRPNRYKGLLGLAFRKCEGHEHSTHCLHAFEARLDQASVPSDLGLWHLNQVSTTGDEALARLHLERAVIALIHQRGAAGLSLEAIEAWGEGNPDKKEWLVPLLYWEIPEWKIEQRASKHARAQADQEQRRERTAHIIRYLDAIRRGTASAGLLHQLAGVWMDRYLDIRADSVYERFAKFAENGDELLSAARSGFYACPARTDLPSVAEIIDINFRQREHYIRLPCLVGMEIRWRGGHGEIDSLPEDALRRMIAFRMTYGAEKTPEWFNYLVVSRPAMVADVLVEYGAATLKSKQTHVDCLYSLRTEPVYLEVARLAVPQLLDSLPRRLRAEHLGHLESLLKTALQQSLAELPEIVARRLVVKGMDVAQRVYWLAAGMLIDPATGEAPLWEYIGSSATRANHLAGFLSERFDRLAAGYELTAQSMGRLIELLAPQADLAWLRRDSFVMTPALQRGDQVRALVTRLGALATVEASQEIDRLLALPSNPVLKPMLQDARHQLRLKQREMQFRFPSVGEVGRILANREPAGVSDLASIALDQLDDIAIELRRENDDGVCSFWNVENRQPTTPREENLCRDILLTRLRARLGALGIDCQPEADYARDKRTDIRLSYRNLFAVPIEIKRDTNKTLWTALRGQLISQYASSPLAKGFGIYLVLWFGLGGIPRAIDGGKAPRSPKELAERLSMQLDPVERDSIFIRVVDVTWPVAARS